MGQVTAALTSLTGTSDGDYNHCSAPAGAGYRTCTWPTGVDTPPAAGEPVDPTGSTDYGVCYFTRVVGAFEESGDKVGIIKAAGQWVIETKKSLGGSPFEWRVECLRQSELANFPGFSSTAQIKQSCPTDGYPVAEAPVPAFGQEAFCPWTLMGGSFAKAERGKSSSGAIPEVPISGQTTVRAECDPGYRGLAYIRSAAYCSRTARPMLRGGELLLDFDTGPLDAYLDPIDDSFCYLSEVGGLLARGLRPSLPRHDDRTLPRGAQQPREVRVRASCILRWQ